MILQCFAAKYNVEKSDNSYYKYRNACKLLKKKIAVNKIFTDYLNFHAKSFACVVFVLISFFCLIAFSLNKSFSSSDFKYIALIASAVCVLVGLYASKFLYKKELFAMVKKADAIEQKIGGIEENDPYDNYAGYNAPPEELPKEIKDLASKKFKNHEKRVIEKRNRATKGRSI